MIIKRDDAFTGLEAAIVLIAFVVVAAVFSYVVLGAGFFTTQKSQEVVHSSVGQASSSLEVIGDVYGLKKSDEDSIDKLEFSLGLTAGGSVVDIDSTEFTISTSENYYLVTPTIVERLNGDEGGNVLERGEQFVIQVSLSPALGTDKEFTLEVKPATGATLGLTRTTPPQIDAINVLY